MQGQVPGSPGLLAVWRDAPEMGREDGREGDETGARLFEPRACEVRSVVRVSVGVAGVGSIITVQVIYIDPSAPTDLFTTFHISVIDIVTIDLDDHSILVFVPEFNQITDLQVIKVLYLAGLQIPKHLITQLISKPLGTSALSKFIGGIALAIRPHFVPE